MEKVGSVPAKRSPPRHSIKLCAPARIVPGFHGKGAHIINPRTKRPVPPKPDRVWAIAPTAALSDAISTAFMVMKPAEIATFCKKHPGVQAILD
jgi:hypothetical protein